jgi:hypothetical protein
MMQVDQVKRIHPSWSADEAAASSERSRLHLN